MRRLLRAMQPIDRGHRKVPALGSKLCNLPLEDGSERTDSPNTVKSEWERRGQRWHVPFQCIPSIVSARWEQWNQNGRDDGARGSARPRLRAEARAALIRRGYACQSRNCWCVGRRLEPRIPIAWEQRRRSRRRGLKVKRKLYKWKTWKWWENHSNVNSAVKF